MDTRKITKQAVTKLLFEARTEIIRCLGKYRHDVSEVQTKYIYYSDLSGRLHKLQNIAGSLFSTSSKTLWKRHEEAVLGNFLRVNPYSLITFMVRLNDLLKPIKNHRPPKKSLQSTIQEVIKKLTEILFILYSANDDRTKQRFVDLIHCSFNFEYAKIILLDKHKNLLDYHFEILLSFILIQSKLQQDHDQKDELNKFIFLIFGLSDKAYNAGLLPQFIHAIEAINQAYYLEHKKNIIHPKLISVIQDSKTLHNLLREKKKPKFTITDKILLLQAMDRFQMKPRDYNLPLISWTYKNKLLAGLIIEKFMPILKPSQAISILLMHYENPLREMIDEKKLFLYLENNPILLNEMYESMDLRHILSNHPLGHKIKNFYKSLNPYEQISNPVPSQAHVMIEMATFSNKAKPNLNPASFFLYSSRTNDIKPPELHNSLKTIRN